MPQATWWEVISVPSFTDEDTKLIMKPRCKINGQDLDGGPGLLTMMLRGLPTKTRGIEDVECEGSSPWGASGEKRNTSWWKSQSSLQESNSSWLHPQKGSKVSKDGNPAGTHKPRDSCTGVWQNSRSSGVPEQGQERLERGVERGFQAHWGAGWQARLLLNATGILQTWGSMTRRALRRGWTQQHAGDGPAGMSNKEGSQRGSCWRVQIMGRQRVDAHGPCRKVYSSSPQFWNAGSSANKSVIYLLISSTRQNHMASNPTWGLCIISTSPWRVKSHTLCHRNIPAPITVCCPRTPEKVTSWLSYSRDTLLPFYTLPNSEF